MRVAYGWKPDSDWGTSPLWQANLSEGQTLKNASYHYLISDHLGTPQLAVNSRGQQTWKGIADAFGNTQLDPDNQITLNLRQPGQYYDQESGLYYNLARHYNPQRGRYIEADPLGVIGGLNLYGYANANPLKYADPYGLWSMDKAWGFIYDTTGWVPSQGLVNCLAGYGDYMSFGATEWLRDKTNVGGVDKCSDAYRYCTYIGMAQDAVTLGRAAFGLGRAVKIYRGYRKANKEFLNYVKNTKEKPAAVVVAVDKNTGKHALNTNGNIPEKVAPELKDMADKLGGLGTKTKCGNIVGRCAEFRAANDLMLQNPRLKAKDIDISGALRPRKLKPVKRCDNCTAMFGPEL
ncbi:hypothetical protein BGI40_08760 [Snodgrassella communis]|uniref:RHS repeat domain-containing protein n=4 Tax=Snodgrassella communis TaxID=2946699 RepID=UPI000C1F8A54|nr:RHS repeat-associated core domain-containing protein [Snodgrassella communis]PIT09045.1 hypothetical protein BGI29_05660 [Snodgrassella communis]PIT26075.1 hypothetical protein BGI39_10660 [Snodgrassella communis]PIT32365.1 hypothetical protein BGI40_08760 [Snodgrassella communis]